MSLSFAVSMFCSSKSIESELLDTAGASLFRTLRKALAEGAACGKELIFLLLERLRRGREVGAVNRTAGESAALAVADLLPALIKCPPSSSSCQKSCLNCIQFASNLQDP